MALGGGEVWLGLFSSWLGKTFCIAQHLPGVAVPEEGGDKPDEQQQRHYNGHDEVADFIAQVHENPYDIKGFQQRENDDHTFHKQDQCCAGIGCFMEKIYAEAKGQLYEGDDGEDDGRLYDLLHHLFAAGLVVKGDF